MTVWTVIPEDSNHSKGRFTGPLLDAPCALGKGGCKPEHDKNEGDGATPLGTYSVRHVFYRPDKLSEPLTGIDTHPLSADMGWCDDVEHPAYNTQVALPFGPSHEKLWRDDDVYDVIVVIGHNDAPVVAGKGSAIFLHIAREGYTPTEGCVALSKPDMLRFLRQAQKGDSLKISYL